MSRHNRRTSMLKREAQGASVKLSEIKAKHHGPHQPGSYRPPALKCGPAFGLAVVFIVAAEPS